jgi:hypothetical protein
MSDGRTCDVCGVRGLVHLEREPEDGPTVNPVVECPNCGRSWIAEGRACFFKITDETTEEELEEIVKEILGS